MNTILTCVNPATGEVISESLEAPPEILPVVILAAVSHFACDKEIPAASVEYSTLPPVYAG